VKDHIYFYLYIFAPEMLFKPPLARSAKIYIFAVPLPNSIMVVRQILDLNVEVRALVGQQRPLAIARGFSFGAGEFTRQKDGENKTVPAPGAMGTLGIPPVEVLG
jgi:hypothetical protein